jgi:hypothetical protein
LLARLAAYIAVSAVPNSEAGSVSGPDIAVPMVAVSLIFGAAAKGFSKLMRSRPAMPSRAAAVSTAGRSRANSSRGLGTV